MKRNTNIPLSIGMSGKYKIEIKRNNTIIKETDWFDNLITDYGISNAKEDIILRCVVGTGVTTPTVLDLKLEQQIAFIDQHPVISNSIENNKKATVYKFTFPKGSVIGNITEVGVSNWGSTDKIISRSLITDSNNIPTALTITDIDELSVYYKILMSVSFADSPVYVLNYNNTNYNVKIKRLFKHIPAVDSSYGYLGSFSGNYSFRSMVYGDYPLSNVNDNSNTPFPNANNTTNSVNYVSYGIIEQVIEKGSNFVIRKVILKNTEYNDARGIRYFPLISGDFYINYSSLYYFEFDPPLVKTNTQELSFTYKVSWGRD